MSFGEQIGLGSALLRAKLLRRRVPLYVQFAVTNRCNLRCRYCDIPSFAGPELSLGEIETLVEGLRRLGTKRIVLLGGEPLLRGDLGEIVRLIKRRGMFAGLVTNGHLVPSRLKDLRGLDTIAVSLDGPEAVHDALRGKGSYRAAVAALEAVAAAGMTRFIGATLVRSNLSSLDHLLEIAGRFSCRVVVNLAYHENAGSSSAAAIRASDGEYRAALTEIIRLKRGGAPLLLSEATYRYVRAWPDLSEDRIRGTARPLPPRSPRCQAGKMFCYIDANGAMSPCALWVGERKALNAVSDGARAAWENCREHDCRACSVACFVDYNAVFSLGPGALWNTLRSYKR